MIDIFSKRGIQRQLERRRAAAVEVIEALLVPGVYGLPKDYEFTLYVYVDPHLEPFWPPLYNDSTDPRIFSPGKGATGTAWKDKELVVVTGSAVANAKYGLTEVQQEFFREYRTVAAHPISENRHHIGVLTVLTKVEDDCFSETGSGQAILRNLSDLIAVLLTGSLPPRTSSDP